MERLDPVFSFKWYLLVN